MAHRLLSLRQQIDEICRVYHRAPETVRLVAVSKNHTVDAVKEQIALGQTDFGENTLQDALTKIPLCGESIHWHFIGRLQSNKIKQIATHFSWVHSLCKPKHFHLLNKITAELKTTAKVLIQANITGDKNKDGATTEGVRILVETILKKNPEFIDLCGLMTIGPYTDNEREQRQTFSKLRILREDIKNEFGLPGFNELSMGMTNDYPAAIAEGATLLRIGSAIFGPRDYA